MHIQEEYCIIASNGQRSVFDASMPQLVQVDSNCACTDSDAFLTQHLPLCHDSTSLSVIKASLYTAPLTGGAFMIFNPLGNSGPVVLNQAAWQLLNNFAQPVHLESNRLSSNKRNAVKRLLEYDLLEPVGTQRSFQRGADQTLVAWLHTTNACNLRCTYCYIDKSDEVMEESTGYAAVDAIFRTAQQHGYPKVKLKYAGGEATLNFGLVMKLHTYARQQAEESGIALRSVILSNGVALTSPMLQFIREEGITLSISLDGLGETHDDQRVFINGRGSAAIVARSIDRALQQGVSPHLSITVTSRNADAVAAAVQFALERNLLFNLNFYRDADTTGNQADLRAEDEQLIAALQRTFAVIQAKLPKHSLLSTLVDRANFASAHETACGAGHSYLVVDQQGRVARCQMEMAQPVSTVFAQDPLTEIRLYDKGFQYSSVAEKEGCRDCEWKYWCAGGCPVLTYRATGRYDVKSPNCRIYKALYPQLLRLEGLRLLQQAPQ